MRALLRLFFRLLYHEFAWTYDLVSWTVSIGQWREWQRQAIPYINGDRLLEIAHGTGNLQLDLIGAGFHPMAVDLSPQMGRMARRKLAGGGAPTALARARAQALPFASGTFTTLLSTFPTEFIVDPPAAREFYRVLAPGGRLVCVPAATIIPGHLADRLARWLFEITGQSATPTAQGGGWPPRLMQVYASAGLRARVESVTLPRSLVWVIVADKPAD